MRKISVLLVFMLAFISCQDMIMYKWSQINYSLGELQDARNELENVISDLEYRGYDCSELENINNRLENVYDVLEAKFE